MAPTKKKPASSPAAQMRRMAKRLDALERETAELREALASSVVQSGAVELPMTQQDIDEANAQAALQDEAEFGYTVSTNLSADIARLLGDRVYAMIEAPRRDAPGEYEEMRLSTASTIVAGMADKFMNIWAESEPLTGQFWSKSPPLQARQELLGYLRMQTVEAMNNKGDEFAEATVNKAFLQNRPTPDFDRLTLAPKAAQEGQELGHRIVLQVFDQLEADQPGMHLPNAEADCLKAMQTSRERVLKILHRREDVQRRQHQKKGRELFEIPRTHEQLFAQCYQRVLLGTIEHAFTLAGAGDEPLPEGVKPLRTAGAILTQLGIPQRPNPDQIPEDKFDLEAMRNYEHVESTKALQMRELLRVVDVVWDSIYNGTLQGQVQAAYIRGAHNLFPDKGPRPITESLKANGWPAVRGTLKSIHNDLFREMLKEDGWRNPGSAVISRKDWNFASPVLH